MAATLVTRPAVRSRAAASYALLAWRSNDWLCRRASANNTLYPQYINSSVYYARTIGPSTCDHTQARRAQVPFCIPSIFLQTIMSLSVDNSTVVLLVSFLLAICYYSLFRKSSRCRPGPKGWPLIDNLLDAPKPRLEWIAYHEMCQRYSASPSLCTFETRWHWSPIFRLGHYVPTDLWAINTRPGLFWGH